MFSVKQVMNKIIKESDYLVVPINDRINIVIKKEPEGYVLDVETIKGAHINTLAIWDDVIDESLDDEGEDTEGTIAQDTHEVIDPDVECGLAEVTETVIGYLGQWLDEKSEFTTGSAMEFMDKLNDKVNRYLDGEDPYED